MTAYSSAPAFRHDDADRVGVLLVNLGTPDAPTPDAVRRFLAEFLSDPRVVEAPRWLWRLALHGFVLRTRPRKSAHAYEQVWTNAGSPLMVHSQALTHALGKELERYGVSVALGMTYGSPSIASALEKLRAAGARKLLVLPLYPQYSGTTTASVFDSVSRTLQSWRWIPELRFIGNYHDEPGYIDALAARISAHGIDGHLLLSFHGVPKRYLLAGDPYHCQCQKTARLLAARLGLQDGDWSVSFQSQVGREEWLQPYTDVWLVEHARRGGGRVTVTCPGFATDCLETLEEIALRNRDAYLAAGGKHFRYIPALNEEAAHVNFLAELVQRHATGWTTLNDPAALAERAQRARRLGAEC